MRNANRITVFGAAGYIGSALVRRFREDGYDVVLVTRDNLNRCPDELGHAVYTIGLTSDFRERPWDTANAHVSILTSILETKKFETLTYLSSTRIYKSECATTEDTAITVSSQQSDDIYALSKLLGEALVLRSGRGKVCRISNVYGGARPSANFISAVLLEAKRRSCVEIMQSPLSSKDYIHIDDVCRAIERVVIDGGQTVYNVAVGENVTHQQIADKLAIEGINVQFRGAETIRFEPISVDKLRSITDWRPRSLVGEIPTLLKEI